MRTVNEVERKVFHKSRFNDLSIIRKIRILSGIAFYVRTVKISKENIKINKNFIFDLRIIDH